MKNLIVFVLFVIFGVGVIAAYTKRVPQTTSGETVKLPFIRQNQFSLENAPADSLRGKIATLSGDVKWQDRVATQSSQITNPINIQQGEELITGDNVQVEIPRAVIINISPKTDLSFVQTLPQNVVLSQTKGTVEYQKTGTVPISIRVLRLLVGGEGNITISVSDTKPTTTINVDTGSATVAYNDSQNVSIVKTINSGEQFIFDNDAREGVIEINSLSLRNTSLITLQRREDRTSLIS